MITLINSFSPNMLSQSRMTLEWTPISIREIETLLEQESFQSYICLLYTSDAADEP